MKLSIIIPVYNVEQYVIRCIKSCLECSYSNNEYELIIVNDGSTDNSLKVIKDTIIGHKNITLINQNNKGLSGARNTGLTVAKGDYVWFVDSDDWIEDDAIFNIINKIVLEPDIIQLQYRLTYDDEKLNRDVTSFEIKGMISGPEVLRRGGLPTPAQFSVFRRQFLIKNNLTFFEGIYHEDAEFKPRATYLAEKIVSVPNVCYNYYQRSVGSIMSSFNIKHALDIITLIGNLFRFSITMPEVDRCYLYDKCTMYFHMLTSKFMQLSTEDRTRVIKLLESDEVIKQVMHNSSNLKYRIEGLLYDINPRLYLIIYSKIK